MSINIDPEKFAELVVNANPAKSDELEDIAKRKQHSILMLTV